MTERFRSASTTGYPSPQAKMASDLGPRKTFIVVVIVVGCFAVLWPKVFYPMIIGSASQHMKPSPIDKATGCCDVISDTDVNTIKIMSELCGTIFKSHDKPLSGKEVVQLCRNEVLKTCGIDISAVLQEQVRLGQSVKQILDEVRSLNGSLCLKYNFGVAPWRLGVPHRITVRMPSESNVKQERPLQLKSEMIHPAFRERGRAIPHPEAAAPSRPPPRIVEGRPGPVPGMRPTIGGAGHVVPPSKQGTSSMSIIMPIYTVGIVVFFTYTLMKIIFKKQPEGVGGGLYPPIDPDPHFRREVFESEKCRLGPRLTRDNISTKLVVNAMSALLDEVDQEIEARRKTSEVASQDLANGSLSNGDAVKFDSEEQSTVKVLGMEMTASCEGGKKWPRPESPVLPIPSPPHVDPVPPPQEIYLEGSLPPQSHLLVSNSATEPQPNTGEDPAVVLAGKMTLSVISLDSSENGSDATNNEERHLDEPPNRVLFDSIVNVEGDLPVQELAGETVDNLILEAIDNIEQNESAIIESWKIPEEKEFDYKREDESVDLQENTVQELQKFEKADEAELFEGASNANILQAHLQKLEEIIEKVKVDQPMVGSFNLQYDSNPIQKLADLQKLDEAIGKAEVQPVVESLNLKEDSRHVQELADLQKLEEFIEKVEAQPMVESLNLQEDSRPVQELADLQKLEEIIEKVESQPMVESSNLQDYSNSVQKLQQNDREDSQVVNLGSEQDAEFKEIFANSLIENKSKNVPMADLKDETLRSAEHKMETLQESVPNQNLDDVRYVESEFEEDLNTENNDKIETAEIILSDGDDELGSDEEIVDEIEEITYESSGEGSEDEAVNVDLTNKVETSNGSRTNGEGNDHLVDSKYNAVRGNRATENDVSDEELTDDEVEYEEEIIEISEEEEVEEDNNDLNHVSVNSEAEN